MTAASASHRSRRWLSERVEGMSLYSSSRQLPVVFCAILLASAERRMLYGKRQTHTNLQEQASATSPALEQTTVERGVLDALKMILPRRAP